MARRRSIHRPKTVTVRQHIRRVRAKVSVVKRHRRSRPR